MLNGSGVRTGSNRMENNVRIVKIKAVDVQTIKYKGRNSVRTVK